jgi:hypothetical protein
MITKTRFSALLVAIAAGALAACAPKPPPPALAPAHYFSACGPLRVVREGLTVEPCVDVKSDAKGALTARTQIRVANTTGKEVVVNEVGADLGWRNDHSDCRTGLGVASVDTSTPIAVDGWLVQSVDSGRRPLTDACTKRPLTVATGATVSTHSVRVVINGRPLAVGEARIVVAPEPPADAAGGRAR